MSTETQSTHRDPFGAGSVFLVLVVLAGGLAAACTTAMAAAPLYRWTDENGVTVYSQQPPPGTEATRLSPAPGPSAEESARAEERIRSLVEQDFDKREEAKRQEQESAQQTDLQARRRANCEAARHNLANLENPQIGRMRAAEGEIQVLTEEVRARYLAEARKVIQENCDSPPAARTATRRGVAPPNRRYPGILETGSTGLLRTGGYGWNQHARQIVWDGSGQ